MTQTNQTSSVQLMVRSFFTLAGLNFSTNAVGGAAGKALFFNDRKGTLFVRSTLSDLELIAQAVEALNQAPPQVNIKAKFAEITQNDSTALGFDWFLGNVLTAGGNAALSGGTVPTYNGAPTTANPSGIFPTGGTAASSSTDGQLTSGLRNAGIPSLGTFTGLLTDPQFQVALKALQQRDGTDLLQAPEITTESGRQAQIQAVEVQTIVTGVGNTATTTAAPTTTTTAVLQQINPSFQYNTSVLPFGPVLDVVPYVSADEFSIQMTIIPTVTEFIGYDNPGQFIPTAAVVGGSAVPLTAVLPLPHYRVRQLVTSCVVWDAQTIVLGGLLTDSVSKISDKVPFLGDIPLLGRLFTSQSNTKTKKNLMIFVTPTIINPDGSRYHSDEEMPFAQNTVPPQTKVMVP